MEDRKHNRQSIRKLTTYVDEDSREVREFTTVFGKDKGESTFNGVAAFKVTSMHPISGQRVVQNMKLEFEFPKDLSLKKVFESFDELSEKRLQEYKKEQEEKIAADRVVAANTVPLMGPNGKPV